MQNKWVLSIVRDGFRIPFNSTPPLSTVPISLSQSFSPLLRENGTPPEKDSGKGIRSGKSRFLFLDISYLEKELKVTTCNRSFSVKSVHKETTIQDGDSQVSTTIDSSQRLGVSIDLTDAYLHIPIHPQSRKSLRFMFESQVFQFTTLPFGMSLSPWIFTKLMDVIVAHLHQSALSLLPYLDDWLIRDLIHNRCISLTIYYLQTVQSLGFIPNLKKSDLIPAQQFTFIWMEFLTQHNIVRVPADCIESLLLTIKLFLAQTQSFSTNFPFSFGQTQCSSRPFS